MSVRTSLHQEEEVPDSGIVKDSRINYSVCVTQFKEVRLGEHRAHQSLIMVRNSNTSQGRDLLAAKEDPFMIKWPKQTTKKFTDSTNT